MDFNTFNPWSKHFLQFSKKRLEKLEEIGKNSVGVGANDQPAIGDVMFQDFNAGCAHNMMGVTFHPYFDSKEKRIKQYREMARYPEIEFALCTICDEAINENNMGEFVNFEIKDTSRLKRTEMNTLREEWNVVINELFNFRETGWDLFHSFLVDGELYFEVVLTQDDKGKKDIIAFKQLPAYTMTPVYQNGEIVKYIQQVEGEDAHEFEADQVLYVNYGVYGDNKLDVRGYLDDAIPLYIMIRNLEESATIAQIVRAPARRVFNIEVGKVPPGKADEIVRRQANNYKRATKFDPTVGLLSEGERYQAMSEDIFFPKFNGEGSSVETLESGQDMEQLIALPSYFLRKLYRVLHISSTRWGDGGLAAKNENGGGNYTNKLEIEREEMNMLKFVERLSAKFCKLFYKAFLLDLKIKELDPAFDNPFNYTITLMPNNRYKEFRELEIKHDQLDLLSQYDSLIHSGENPNGIFAKEYFLKTICGFTQSQLDQNEELLKAEEEKDKVESIEGGEASFGDGTGGFGGGGSFNRPSFGGGSFGGGELGNASAEEPSAEPEAPAESGGEAQF